MSELRRAIVTGAGGFIGREVCRRLVKSGYEVRAHVGPPGDTIETPPDVAIVIRASLTESDAMNELFDRGADVVIHLAGPPSVKASFEDPIGFVLAHTAGSAAILEASRMNAVRRFVYISSAEVYGRPLTDPVDESHRIEARSPYAAAKIGAEQMIYAYGHAYGIQSMILRPFSVYGRGMGRHALLPAIIRQLDGEGPLRLADLRPQRDYCHVEDIGRAIVAAASAATKETVVVNIGSGSATSVGELAARALRLVGSDRSVESDGSNPRPGSADILRLVADRRRALDLLGWEPRVTLEEGLHSMIAARAVGR